MATEVRDTYMDPKTIIMTPAGGGAPIGGDLPKKEDGLSFKKGLKIICTLVSWMFFGYVGWLSCLQFGMPTYNEVATELSNEGHAAAGTALSESRFVCQDGGKTHESCKSLWRLAIEKALQEKSKELAQK